MPDSLSAISLSLTAKIGQLFLMGFRGNDISENSDIIKDVTDHKPGGVIFFDKDMAHHKPVNNIVSPEQVKELTAALQSASDIPLLIGIDQEGGLVNRLKPEYGFPQTQSHQKLGQIDDVNITTKESLLISSTLADSGINLNFAPVVDLSKNLKSSIIAKRERSFGNSAELVTRHSEAYSRGHLENNIIPCCKHFPGHGSAEGDTHEGFVNVTDSWDEDELKPYKNLIDKGLCPMIMTAHIFHSGLDEDYPSTLSKKVLTKLLREEMNFDGVIISDDMQMKAISDHFELKEALRLGLEAGVDIFCFGNNLFKEQIRIGNVVQLIKELIDEGKISEGRIDESVNRILNLKSSFNL